MPRRRRAAERVLRADRWARKRLHRARVTASSVYIRSSIFPFPRAFVLLRGTQTRTGSITRHDSFHHCSECTAYPLSARFIGDRAAFASTKRVTVREGQQHPRVDRESNAGGAIEYGQREIDEHTPCIQTAGRSQPTANSKKVGRKITGSALT